MNKSRLNSSGPGRFALILAVLGLAFNTGATAQTGIEAPGNAPASIGDRVIAAAAEQQAVSFALTLPYPDEAAVDDFLKRLYTAGDPQFHHFLTSQQFTDRFGPTQAQYQALKSLATQNGLSVEQEFQGRTTLRVSAPAATLRNLFGVHMQMRQSAEGVSYLAPDIEPVLPFQFANLGAKAAGLYQKPLHNYSRRIGGRLAAPPTKADPLAGSGPGGLLQPADILKAYDVGGIQNGGQAVAVFELSTATYGDVATYASHFGLNNPTLQQINVDGGTTDNSGADEVILDIEMVMAITNAKKVLVYTAPNGTGIIDLYQRIADDNLVHQVSTSWGLYEAGEGLSNAQAENTIFKKMVGEGMALFAASGDSGAYADGSTISVQDPASQPNLTGVGGTVLKLDTAQNYLSESAWGDTSDTRGSAKGAGSGGGISSFWSIPSYQTGVVSSAPTGEFSTTMRNVPDISLAGSYDDTDSSYYIYVTDPSAGAGWYGFSGTSAAAPLWAGYWSLVNQALSAKSEPVAGFANPLIYKLAENTTSYARDFHDVNDNTTNLHYHAVNGYDTATGWGSFNGANLLQDIVSDLAVLTAPTNLTATAGVGSVTLSWSASTNATSYQIFEGTGPGGESSTAIAQGITTTSHTVTGLTPGKTYYFKVAAAANGTVSAQSNEASAAPTTPAAPTGVTATAGGGSVVLHWNASSGATGYKVYQGTTPGGESNTAIVGVTTTSYTVTGLTPGQTYYFKIAAAAYGVHGVQSGEVNAVPLAPAPTGLTAVTGSTTGTVSLHWNAVSGASGYKVYEGSTPGGESNTAIAGITTTSYTATGLTSGHTYYFKVAAATRGIHGPQTAEVSAAAK